MLLPVAVLNLVLIFFKYSGTVINGVLIMDELL